MKKILIGLALLFITGQSYGVVLRSLVDTDGDMLEINANGSVNIAISSAPAITISTITTRLIQAEDSDGLKLQDGGGNLGIFIEDGGNVGIGTTTPSALLDVNGQILATNVRIKAGSPNISWVNTALGDFETTTILFEDKFIIKEEGEIDAFTVALPTGNVTIAGSLDIGDEVNISSNAIVSGSVSATSIIFSINIDTTSAPSSAGILGAISNWDLYISTGIGAGEWVKIGSQ